MIQVYEDTYDKMRDALNTANLIINKAVNGEYGSSSDPDYVYVSREDFNRLQRALTELKK